ncbi:MAG: non-ribosomal peptide synthetase [Rhodococcus sp. (in: high G+C Gram-positive bacteria)]|uniref:thioesterase domain-containing protein n=1 Tax=Rhodococcus sp. TaxID=1831 RepID=UPI002ADAE347|nr:non-ribosomal peptide synthetase [Rhodococcus sp. (in: high G+C Gram-positive bacteria)]
MAGNSNSEPNLTEQEIARIWSEVLGITPIGPGDRFSDLGGTSLAAESMIAMSRSRLPTSIAAADFVDDPTVAELAERLDSSHRARFTQRASACVQLQQGTRAPAVFCFAGAGSTSAYFVPLARALPAEIPVYSLQAHGIESRALPTRTVARAARRHMRELRAVQPRGPYLLLGHSFGGVVALEVARALEKAGEQVAELIMLDTVVDSEASLKAWTEHDDSFVNEAHAVDTAPTAGRIRSLGQRIAVHARLVGAGLLRYRLGTQKHVFWELAIRAQRRHHLRPWGGHATVLLTKHAREQREFWPSFLSGGVDIIDVPGDHLSMIADPEVLEILASKFV